MYTVFIRSWYRKEGKNYVPNPGARRTILRDNIRTQEEARKICEEYNSTHNPGPTSRKAEYTSNY